MAKETMTVRVEAEMRETLDDIAASLDRDRSWVVKEALRNYVDLHAWQIAHIEEGRRQADAGKFVSPAEMKKRIHRMIGTKTTK